MKKYLLLMFAVVGMTLASCSSKTGFSATDKAMEVYEKYTAKVEQCTTLEEFTALQSEVSSEIAAFESQDFNKELAEIAMKAATGDKKAEKALEDMTSAKAKLLEVMAEKAMELGSAATSGFGANDDDDDDADGSLFEVSETFEGWD